jgi:hypothetical protein
MARRRYEEVTSGSRKSHQEELPWHSLFYLYLEVKSSRNIAHSDAFEGQKLI